MYISLNGGVFQNRNYVFNKITNKNTYIILKHSLSHMKKNNIIQTINDTTYITLSKPN